MGGMLFPAFNNVLHELCNDIRWQRPPLRVAHNPLRTRGNLRKKCNAVPAPKIMVPTGIGANAPIKTSIVAIPDRNIRTIAI